MVYRAPLGVNTKKGMFDGDCDILVYLLGALLMHYFCGEAGGGA